MLPLYVFLLSGLVSMSVALSAGAINKQPEEDRPNFAKSRNGQVAVIMMGNFSALTLLAAMAYGVLKLDWWIPLSCLFISFPVVHQLLLQKYLGDKWVLITMAPLTLVSAIVLVLYW